MVKKAVSYTHLDVYKRQGVDCSPLRAKVEPVEDTSWLQLFIKNTALCKHESGRIGLSLIHIFGIVVCD